MVEPLDDLPGAKDYLADFTESARQVAVWDGKLMGLPYFSTVWVWNYYSDLLEKAKFEPFKTYEELLEQLRKAKKDKIVEYPIQWVAGVGLEQLPGTWYQLTWNRGTELPGTNSPRSTQLTTGIKVTPWPRTNL